MSGYINPEILWSPETLSDRLGQPGLSVIDTRPAEMFATGHIPGARHFDPYFVNCDDTDPAPLRSFTRMWSDMLAWRGVSETDTIVFYGAFPSCKHLNWVDLHDDDGCMKPADELREAF